MSLKNSLFFQMGKQTDPKKSSKGVDKKKGDTPKKSGQSGHRSRSEARKPEQNPVPVHERLGDRPDAGQRSSSQSSGHSSKSSQRSHTAGPTLTSHQSTSKSFRIPKSSGHTSSSQSPSLSPLSTPSSTKSSSVLAKRPAPAACLLSSISAAPVASQSLPPRPLAHSGAIAARGDQHAAAAASSSSWS